MSGWPRSVDRPCPSLKHWEKDHILRKPRNCWVDWMRGLWWCLSQAWPLPVRSGFRIQEFFHRQFAFLNEFSLIPDFHVETGRWKLDSSCIRGIPLVLKEVSLGSCHQNWSPNTLLHTQDGKVSFPACILCIWTLFWSYSSSSLYESPCPLVPTDVKFLGIHFFVEFIIVSVSHGASDLAFDSIDSGTLKGIPNLTMVMTAISSWNPSPCLSSKYKWGEFPTFYFFLLFLVSATVFVTENMQKQQSRKESLSINLIGNVLKLQKNNEKSFEQHKRKIYNLSILDIRFCRLSIIRIFKIPFIKLICLSLRFLISYRNVLWTPYTSIDPTLQMKLEPAFWQVFVAREIKQQGLVSGVKLQFRKPPVQEFLKLSF